MIIEKEYRGMAYTTEEQRKELEYSVIFRYYRIKEKLIDSSYVYGINIESTIIYDENKYNPEKYESQMVISSQKEIANQIIEIFRLNQVAGEGMEYIYDDICAMSHEDRKLLLKG